MALNFDDLRAFVLVANERSVSKAAERLGVSQQSTSERIRRIESRLETKLFDRLSHGMAPTPAGFRFLPYATQCLSLIEQAFDSLSGSDLVRVALQRSVSNAVRPFLDSFVNDASIRVDLTDADPDAIAMSLLANEIDAAIGVFNTFDRPRRTEPEPRGRRRATEREVTVAAPEEERPSYQSGRVVAEALFSDRLVVAAPAGHPLTRHGQPLQLAELIPLSNTPQGSVDPGAHGDAQGIRIGPQSELDPEITEGRLVEIPVDAPGWVMPISIAYRELEVERPGIVALIKELRDKGAPASESTAPTNGSLP